MLSTINAKMLNVVEVVEVKWLVGAALLLHLTFVLFKSQLRILWLMLRLPGPKAYPLIGNAQLPAQQKGILEHLETAYKEHGPLVRIWITVFPMILLQDPNHIQKVLSSSKHIEKIYFYKMLHNFLGEGLITSRGPVWKNHRKLIQPSFHLSVLEEFVPVFSTGAQIMVDTVEKRVQKESFPINMTSFINKCILSIMNEAVLGLPIDPRKVDMQHETSPFRQGSPTMQYRWSRPWLLLGSLYKLTGTAKKESQQKNTITSFTQKVLKERKEAREKGTISNKCMLDYLMDLPSDSQFTDDECIQEACTMMLAGQDSVGAAVAFCLHLLANNEQHQETVVEELRNIFGPYQRPATSLDLRRMVYLEQCLKETMRLYPSVPIIARTLGDDVDLGEHILPKGCEVLISPYATHRIEEHFPKPTEFHPERFAPGSSDKRHPYAYLPFSAGPRNCIGYKFAMIEMKAIVSTILRKYKLSSVPGKEDLDVKYRMTMRSGGGVWVTLSQREEFNDR